MRAVDCQMQKALTENVFPGAVLMVARRGVIEFFEAYGRANLFTQETMTVETVFDLASLTKPLATTLAVMKLMEEGGLSLNRSLCDFWPEFRGSPKAAITIEMLLRHTSGYAAHRTYYKMVEGLGEWESKEKIRNLLLNEPLVNAVGKATVYSDLGFMLLSEIIFQETKMHLDQWVIEKIYTPLGLNGLFFVRHFESLRRARYAATELCPFRHLLLCGAVHDDNAYAMGGVCGHAGLFGPAKDIMRLLSALLHAYLMKSDLTTFSSQLVRLFFKRPPGDGRPLGFDVPTLGRSSSGKYFSKESVGHLGFTGTSFWMDLEREIIVVLLTNRVHPHRCNNAIRQFRPVLHDAVMTVFGSKEK